MSYLQCIDMIIYVSANYISYLLLEIDFCLYSHNSIVYIHYIFFFTTLSDFGSFVANSWQDPQTHPANIPCKKASNEWGWGTHL